VHAFNGASSISTHNGSPFAMVALHAMLTHWGDDGLDRHIEGVRAEYRRRMRVMLDAADAELEGLAIWTRPAVGMFV
jgi:DNA-binding transcriptional MocR family regulator